MAGYLQPAELLAGTGGSWIGDPPAELTGASIDTRTLAPGELFIALRGAERDGHAYLAAAAAGGAAAAVVSTPDPGLAMPQLVVDDTLAALHRLARARRAAFAGPVIGLTGSCGKTSTKDLLALLLGGDEVVARTRGNFNNRIGLPLTLLGVRPGRHQFAVIEAGISLPGEMDELAALLVPDHVIVTLVAEVHLEGLGSIEGVAEQKARLPAARRGGGWVVFPGDCLRFEAFRRLAAPGLIVGPAEAVVPTGFGVVLPELNWRADGAVNLILPDGEAPSGREHYLLTGAGSGMARNAALALVLARRLGMPAAVLRERLLRWKPPRWRGELLRRGRALIWADCYNASPVSLADALETFNRRFPAERERLFILGSMLELGSAAADWHRKLGAGAGFGPHDTVWYIGDHGKDFAAGAAAAGWRGRIRFFSDPAELAPMVRDFEGPVLIKGSRRWKLETCLPPETAAPSNREVPC
ncbi:MAG: UDP-N-acetylmuramoyl-tripeptide--D-alanyl-D-alanine ligase [Puniceicoccaceae bacterium]|nr:MAG: UDP-N-acetylmuramoyl-tripeptide--D-alanyl-D-alanine ligase [Puniceicoccaceae bacterium]